MADTARLRLPQIAAAQAQKHVTHNEALVALDSLVQISVVDKDLDTPPGSPAEGDCYIVAAGGSGDWTGWDGRVARFEDGAWRSFLPGAGDGEGWLAYVQDEAAFYVRDGAGNWVRLASVLALGTAAQADIGVSGDVVPKLNTNCTVSGTWTFNNGTSFPLTLLFQDNGASAGPVLHFNRATASAAANDLLGGMRLAGRNDAGGYAIYGEAVGGIVDPANGSEAGLFTWRTAVAGSLDARFSVAAGLYTPNATGGDQGVDTINAGALYDDGVLLTCMALQDEFLQTGTIDPEANWDPKVPDIVIPERIEELPVADEVIIERPVLKPQPDGSFVLRRERARERCDRIELVPVYDDAGNGVDAVEQPVTERIVTPARTIARRHGVAHLFKRMLDDGFDPRDPAQYVAKLRADKALPGMPTAGEWRHNTLSVGELMSRKWLAMEMLALVVVNHEERIAALERESAG